MCTIFNPQTLETPDSPNKLLRANCAFTGRYRLLVLTAD